MYVCIYVCMCIYCIHRVKSACDAGFVDAGRRPAAGPFSAARLLEPAKRDRDDSPRNADGPRRRGGRLGSRDCDGNVPLPAQVYIYLYI